MKEPRKETPGQKTTSFSGERTIDCVQMRKNHRPQSNQVESADEPIDRSMYYRCSVRRLWHSGSTLWIQNRGDSRVLTKNCLGKLVTMTMQETQKDKWKILLMGNLSSHEVICFHDFIVLKGHYLDSVHNWQSRESSSISKLNDLQKPLHTESWQISKFIHFDQFMMGIIAKL